MRLIEVITPPSRVLVTPEFSETYSEFATAAPSVEEKFKRFITLKLNGENVPNDKLFSNGHLSGYWHHHFIKGKIIVVYKQTGNDLRLYIVTNHAGYDGTPGQRLGQWMRSLPDSHFTELDLKTLFNPEEKAEPISPEEKRQLNNVVYDLIAADGFYILKPAVEKNDWSSFFEWLASDLPGIDPEAVFAAYGGVKRLQIFILDNVERFGKEEEYRNA